MDKLLDLYKEIDARIDMYVRAPYELIETEYNELGKLFEYQKALEEVFKEKGIKFD